MLVDPGYNFLSHHTSLLGLVVDGGHGIVNVSTSVGGVSPDAHAVQGEVGRKRFGCAKVYSDRKAWFLHERSRHRCRFRAAIDAREAISADRPSVVEVTAFRQANDVVGLPINRRAVVPLEAGT